MSTTVKNTKKLQDHKPKQGAVSVQGIELLIPQDRINDWDVVEGVATMQDDESTPPEKLVASVRVMKRLLGDDYDKVKTGLRAANGGALTADIMGAFLTEVFEELNPNS